MAELSMLDQMFYADNVVRPNNQYENFANPTVGAPVSSNAVVTGDLQLTDTTQNKNQTTQTTTSSQISNTNIPSIYTSSQNSNISTVNSANVQSNTKPNSPSPQSNNSPAYSNNSTDFTLFSTQSTQPTQPTQPSSSGSNTSSIIGTIIGLIWFGFCIYAIYLAIYRCPTVEYFNGVKYYESWSGWQVFWAILFGPFYVAFYWLKWNSSCIYSDNLNTASVTQVQLFQPQTLSPPPPVWTPPNYTPSAPISQ